MGCARRVLMILAILWNLIFWALTALVIGDSRVLGEAAMIHENDATMLFIGAIGGFVLTLLLGIMLVAGRRSKRELSEN